jgi:hypothetical protein
MFEDSENKLPTCCIKLLARENVVYDAEIFAAKGCGIYELQVWCMDDAHFVSELYHFTFLFRD